MTAHGRSKALMSQRFKREDTSVSARGRSKALISKRFRREGFSNA
jgi:hypothetical protein